MQPELRDLYQRVTLEIFAAERAKGEARKLAWRRVSLTEEEIATLTSPDSIDGSVARLGAFTAAWSAGDFPRALALKEKFGLTTEMVNESVRQSS